MKTIAREHDLLSTGRVCELLQATPNCVERAAVEANVLPSLRLNGADYWGDSAVEAIRVELSTTGERIVTDEQPVYTLSQVIDQLGGDVDLGRLGRFTSRHKPVAGRDGRLLFSKKFIEAAREALKARRPAT